MVRRILLASAAAALLVMLATPASAIPKDGGNNFSDVGTADCPSPIGEQTLIFQVHPENSSVAFLGSGQTVVAKRVASTFTATVELVSTGQVLATLGPESELEVRANGGGFDKNLVTCDFSASFSFTDTLDAETAAEFGIAPSFIGQAITFEAQVTGTAEVLVVGQRP
jgi:hypothetical protein